MVHVCVFKKITKIYYIFGKNARNKCFRSKYWQFSANIGQMFAFLTAGISLISLKISLKLRFTPISTKDMQKLWQNWRKSRVNSPGVVLYTHLSVNFRDFFVSLVLNFGEVTKLLTETVTIAFSLLELTFFIRKLCRKVPIFRY